MQVMCIPVDIWEQMQAHVESCLPEEGCGFLGGKGGQVEVCFPVSNAARSPVRYAMDPFEQLRAMKAIESQGLDVVAIFHSHPSGPALLSTVDLDEFAYPGTASVVLSPTRGGWWLKAFWIENHAPAPIEIIIQRNREKPEGL